MVQVVKVVRKEQQQQQSIEAIRIIESELNCNIYDVFMNFPTEPIAAASLGWSTTKLNNQPRIGGMIYYFIC
jgi:hypothetical protein